MLKAFLSCAYTHQIQYKHIYLFSLCLAKLLWLSSFNLCSDINLLSPTDNHTLFFSLEFISLSSKQVPRINCKRESATSCERAANHCTIKDVTRTLAMCHMAGSDRELKWLWDNEHEKARCMQLYHCIYDLVRSSFMPSSSSPQSHTQRSLPASTCAKGENALLLDV